MTENLSLCDIISQSSSIITTVGFFLYHFFSASSLFLSFILRNSWFRISGIWEAIRLLEICVNLHSMQHAVVECYRLIKSRYYQSDLEVLLTNILIVYQNWWQFETHYFAVLQNSVLASKACFPPVYSAPSLLLSNAPLSLHRGLRSLMSEILTESFYSEGYERH